MHPVLAEYNRRLVLRSEAPETDLTMFPDTGGCTRANLYRTSETEFILRDCSGEIFEIGLTPSLIRRVENDGVRGKLTFIGCFDSDVDGELRFIPAAQRRELAVGMREGPDSGN